MLSSLSLLLTFYFTIVKGEVSCNASNQHVYNNCECLEFVIKPQVSWANAVKKCEAKGAQLITIHDKEKQDFVRNLLNRVSDKNGVWIGLERNEDGQFQWLDGRRTKDEYSSWAFGEPDNLLKQKCVLMHRDHRWNWKDFFCGLEPYSYICQYDIPCKKEESTGLSTNEVVGIVVGGVVGLICFFAVFFLLINCCRDAVRRKRHQKPEAHLREVELGPSYGEDMYTAEPMITAHEVEPTAPSIGATASEVIPPPEKAGSGYPENDLDRVSVKKKRTPLTTTNVVVAAGPSIASTSRQQPSRQSTKISNLPPSYESVTEQDKKRKASIGSIEDNYLSANTDTDDAKNFTSNVEGVEK